MIPGDSDIKNEVYKKNKIRVFQSGELEEFLMVNGFKTIGKEKIVKMTNATTMARMDIMQEIVEVGVVDVQEKDLVEEYALSTICEYSCDLKNDRIIDPGCYNHIIGYEVEVYKDLKSTGALVIEGRKWKLSTSCHSKKSIKTSVLPNTQELQEKLPIELQLGPSEDVADQTELGELKSPINEKLRVSKVQSKSRSCRLVIQRRSCQSHHKSD
ncbi:hypothetical protein LIER_20776 [Lithospermum erythrorhizon]|uniref:Uncharacterized protein n=1 Tax=Lithospermum erythrorhizon TaxID=34254 RepID=A0AAV3QP61_LITER